MPRPFGYERGGGNKNSKKKYKKSKGSDPNPILKVRQERSTEEEEKEELGFQYARFKRMGENQNMGLKKTTGRGEIVQVEGGHIVRSTGRKDRHSKVCTAKGPRDRRVRLSAHTAIQFYDVQDRLGYDRPSKAVDWLIKKAKSAIDELAELPAWEPTSSNPIKDAQSEMAPGSSKNPVQTEPGVFAFGFQNNPTTFLPIASSSSIDTVLAPYGLQNSFENTLPYDSKRKFSPIPPSTTQDLRLSLQSFQDPIFLPHHPPSHQQTLFSSPTFYPFSTDHQHYQQSEIGQFQRMVAWNASDSARGFAFNSPPAQNQLFSQRGPLQSSNTPSFRAWPDPSEAISDHQTPASLLGFGFASSGSFSGFRIPTRIQGEEEHDLAGHKLSASSSDPHR